MSLSLLIAQAQAEQPNAPGYDAQVRPILARHCFKCHGPEERKGGLRLSVASEAHNGGDSGPALKKNEAGEYLILRRITAEEEDDRMPPKGPGLNESEVAVIAAWLDGGASYGDSESGEEDAFWSFKPPVQPSPPFPAAATWGSNAIDAFLLQSMNRQGLSPSPEADRSTLIRRLSLDLRGLPPKPEEVEAFLADESPDAYEALVERFLASPHYGERMAIGWLDVARYADTNGYEKDRPRSIWPYRDWVIDAFNEDMPFDRFVIEQVAGDMLPSPTLDQRIATGFFRNEMLNEEGGIDVEEFRYKNVVDRTNTTATALLGLTMSCAQCHTHKYDPISHAEYFQLFAFLNNTDDVTLDVPDPVIAEQRAGQQAKINALKAALRSKFPADNPFPRNSPLKPETARAELGGALDVLDGNIIDVTKAEAERNTYVVHTTVGPGRVDGLVLDVFTNGTGPGRTPHGNFVLSEFIAYKLDGDTRTSIVINRAEAPHAQANYPIEHAFDGKADTGWAIDGNPAGINRDHSATFYFETPLELESTQPIEIRLDQQFGNRHTLGNFRLRGVTLELPESSVPEEERRERFFAEQFDRWTQDIRARANPWQELAPIEMTAEKHTTLTRLEDNSILAEGDLPNNDVYHLKMRSSAEGITGLRLEVLPHESLPGGGPGRGVILAEGDFLLTGVKVSASSWNAPETASPVKIIKATQSFANGDKTAEKALDGRTDTGWSIHGKEGKPNAAVFAFDTPQGYPEGTLFDITLEQKYIHQHTLGRFRLSVTNEKLRPEATGVPAEIEALVLSRAESPEARTTLEQYFLEHTPLLAESQAEIAQLEQQMPRFPTTLALEEREQVRTTHVYHRGEFLQPKEAVRPNVPAVLPPLPEFEPRNRLTLAKWLVSEDNPLTARVTVNRLWQRFFGRGLVETVDDFGLMGEAPTHPELLDWMAVEFMRRGWRVKDMVRLIVTSDAYRQSARITPEVQKLDPRNTFLARAPRFRVDAEFVRDIALAASGSLDGAIGGPGVFPPLPDGLLDCVYGGFSWTTDTGEARHRRGMYTYWKRMLPYPTAAVFDAPARDMVCVRRLRTNTPMQALTLLNDEVFMDAARTMADDLIRSTPEDPATRLRALFMRCLSRQPDPKEEAAMLAYLSDQTALLAAQPIETVQALVLPAEGKEARPEQAAWTLLCRVVLNLDETITRG